MVGLFFGFDIGTVQQQSGSARLLLSGMVFSDTFKHAGTLTVVSCVLHGFWKVCQFLHGCCQRRRPPKAASPCRGQPPKTEEGQECLVVSLENMMDFWAENGLANQWCGSMDRRHQGVNVLTEVGQNLGLNLFSSQRSNFYVWGVSVGESPACGCRVSGRGGPACHGQRPAPVADEKKCNLRRSLLSFPSANMHQCSRVHDGGYPDGGQSHQRPQ